MGIPENTQIIREQNSLGKGGQGKSIKPSSHQGRERVVNRQVTRRIRRIQQNTAKYPPASPPPHAARRGRALKGRYLRLPNKSRSRRGQLSRRLIFHASLSVPRIRRLCPCMSRCCSACCCCCGCRVLVTIPYTTTTVVLFERQLLFRSVNTTPWL
jgi:hypothetical protein